MTTLRWLLLLQLFVICSLASTVTPVVGYIGWASQNGNQTGYFEVVVDTNTSSAQVTDDVKLTNIHFEIDVQVAPGVINTQTVLLYRAAYQSDLALNPPPATTLLSYECSPADCPAGTTSYFSQLFGPTTGETGSVVAPPQIIAARLTYTAVANGATGQHWTYRDPVTGALTQFSPYMLSYTVSLLPTPNGSFMYNGIPTDYAVFSISGETVPEPATAMLCGIGLVAACIYRTRRSRRISG